MATQFDIIPLWHLAKIYAWHGTITIIDGDKKEATVEGTASIQNKEIITYGKPKIKKKWIY